MVPPSFDSTLDWTQPIAPAAVPVPSPVSPPRMEPEISNLWVEPNNNNTEGYYDVSRLPLQWHYSWAERNALRIQQQNANNNF